MELFETTQRQLSEAQDEVVALRAANERLTAKCNRMCRSAKIEDIHPGMTPVPEEGMSIERLGELKRLASHSSSLGDLFDAVIELIEEVRRLKRC